MKVGFVGAYCTANFGDWSILINNIIDINAEENVIFTYSNSFPHYAVNYYCSNRNIKFKEVNIIENKEYMMPLIPFEIKEAISNIDEISQEIEQVDILCVSGASCIIQI